MTYHHIEIAVADVHSDLLDLQHDLKQIRINDFTNAELEKTEYLLTFLRKHLSKPLMMPRIRNPKPRSQS